MPATAMATCQHTTLQALVAAPATATCNLTKISTRPNTKLPGRLNGVGTCAVGVVLPQRQYGRSVQTICSNYTTVKPQKTTIRHGQRHLVALRRRTVDHTVGLLAGESLDSEDDRRSAIARFYKKRARAELAPAEDTPHAKPG